MNERLTVSIAQGAPLYRDVKRKIIEAVRRGEWKPGDAIPSEKGLCERYGVSMGTVRKAVDELSAEGVLIRHQGRGTFVATHDADRYLFAFFHVVRQDGHKEYPKVDLVEFGTVKADAGTAAMLHIDAGSRLFRLVNSLALSGAPVGIDEILLPESLFPGLTEQRLRDRPGTLYQLYQDEFQISVVRAAERLRAVAADENSARLLGMTAGDPLLRVARVALSFRDQPVELRHSYVDTRRHEYRAEPMGASQL